MTAHAGQKTPQHLLLAGGGHSHVHVLHSLAMRPEPNLRVTVVSPNPEMVYSGMLPATLVGLYDEGEGCIDVAALAARARATFLSDEIEGLEPGRNRVITARHGEIPYDLLSLGVGSKPPGLDGFTSDPEVVGVRPVESASQRIRGFLQRARNREQVGALVVGGGAGGVELAFALRRALRVGPRARVGIVEEGDQLLPSGSRRAQELVSGLAPQYEIDLHLGRRVVGVEPGAVALNDGEVIEADLVIWATGATGLEFVARSGVAVDSTGFVTVDDQLRCTSHANIFASGDCARMVSHPQMPRAGVFAVRQGPVLDENLRRSVRGRPLLRYRPQRDFLSLLSTGDGRAVMSYRGHARHGRFWWRLKDWIDRRFIARYRPPRSGALRASDDMPGSMEMEPCGGCAAKVAPDVLSRALESLGRAPAQGVEIGLDAPDDAAVLEAPEGEKVLFTVDAFPPFLADLRLVGEVAAINALSDIYAMGGRPTGVLALAAVDATQGPVAEYDLEQLMAGARSALERLGAPLVGGHTLAMESPLVGFAVMGRVRPDDLMTKGRAQAGDLILLTKPLGTGVLLAATRAGECPARWTNAAVTWMRQANDGAARFFLDRGVATCTDVSGFGLAGHLAEVLRTSGLGGEIWLEAIPALPGALELLEQGWRSSADPLLAEPIRADLDLETLDEADARIALLRDPQTSGGLLATMAPDAWEQVRGALPDGLTMEVIGRVVAGRAGRIGVRERPLA